MQIIKDLQQNTQEWLDARRGKITGSKLKDIVVKRGTGKKMGFYELLASRLAVDTKEDDGIERGHALEGEALDLFEKEQGVKLERGLFCVSDKNPNIALSPDALIKTKGKYTKAVEVKCLSSARHLQALLEEKIPTDYFLQVLQYFIVNDDLETLYLTFYDPRVTVMPIFHKEIPRKNLEENIKIHTEIQEKELQEVSDIINKLSF